MQFLARCTSWTFFCTQLCVYSTTNKSSKRHKWFQVWMQLRDFASSERSNLFWNYYVPLVLSLSSSLWNIIAIVGSQTKGLYQRLLMSPPQPLSHGHQLLPLYSHSFIPLYVEIGWPTINFRVNSGRIYYPLSASIALMEIYFTSLLCPI